MASAFSHAAAAMALGVACWRPKLPARYWVLGAACAVLPDLDVVAFLLGIPYEHVLGHRGLSHSFLFAACLAAIVVAVFFPEQRERRATLWVYFFLATSSHAMLDALTSGGLGVAFFAPFENSRYFFPWRPIEVSPINLSRFFSARGLAVLRSEVVWVWLPSVVLIVVVLLWRRAHQTLRRTPAA